MGCRGDCVNLTFAPPFGWNDCPARSTQAALAGPGPGRPLRFSRLSFQSVPPVPLLTAGTQRRDEVARSVTTSVVLDCAACTWTCVSACERVRAVHVRGGCVQRMELVRVSARVAGGGACARLPVLVARV